MSDDHVQNNLKGMDDLDFTGWNNADWDGVFADHHTDDVLVEGQPSPADPTSSVGGMDEADVGSVGPMSGPIDMGRHEGRSGIPGEGV